MARIELETVNLIPMPFEIREFFSPAVMQKMRFESYQEQMLDRMVMRLSGEILAEKIAEANIPVQFTKDVHFSYPKNWWNHLKDQWNDWFIPRRPRWMPISIGLMFVRPVKMKTVVKTVSERKMVKTQQFALFPMHNIVTPENLRGPVVVRREEVSYS